MNKKNIAVVLIFACIAVGAILLFPLLSHSPEADDVLAEPTAEPVQLSIVCAGDIMAHVTQVKAQDMGDGTYDFTNNFEYVRPYIQAADLAICNVETTFSGSPYTGYPSFSTPDSLAEALAQTGFDVASTANNHMLDRGKSGLLRTLEVLNANGFKTTGSIAEQGEPRYAMYQTKGIDIAVIAYTYQTPTNNRSVSINGSIISDELASYINSFGYEYIDEELVKINGTVQEAREAGADIVILFYHWGEEYQLAANQWQRYMAEKTVEQMDIDIIFGSHPHVLQEMEMFQKTVYTEPADGTTPTAITKDIPVYFSLGNFISNQRTETLDIPNDKYTEQGVIAMVDISIMEDSGEIVSISMDALPTWVDRYTVNGKNYYYIIPLDDNLSTNATLATSGHLSRAESAREDANGLLGINR